jgi:hypothetical protein
MNDAPHPANGRRRPLSLATRLDGARCEHGVGAVRLSIGHCDLSTRRRFRIPSVPVMTAGVLAAASGSCETLVDPGHGCIDSGRTRTQDVPVQDLPGGNRVGR